MRFSEDIQVRLTDTSLRDGSHAKAHQFTVDDIKKVVTALDSAGMPVIEDTIEVTIAIPAEGPSFGVAPSGTCI